MPAEGAVRIKGLRDLNRAFARADADVRKEFRGTLRDAAEPVRTDAERLASREIRNIGRAWERMRVGVTQRLVYVAPRERGTRSGARRRPNLGGLLMDKAMQPALDQNRETIVRDVERMLDDIGRDWER